VRTSFELKILADTISYARTEAYRHIAAFIECDLADVVEKVDVEFKVKTMDISENSEDGPVWSRSNDLYEVTVFGTLKQSVLKPL